LDGFGFLSSGGGSQPGGGGGGESPLGGLNVRPPSLSVPCSPVMNGSTTSGRSSSVSSGRAGGGLSGGLPLPQSPGGVTPNQPGCVMPLSGSVVTVRPSADTVAVPVISSMPVVWLNE